MLENDIGKILGETLSSNADARLKVMYIVYLRENDISYTQINMRSVFCFFLSKKKRWVQVTIGVIVAKVTINNSLKILNCINPIVLLY